MEPKNYPIVAFDFDEWDLNDGLSIISLVNVPAVDKNFLKFSKEKESDLFYFNKDKKIITGPALRANYPILRYDEENQSYYYITFSPEIIEKIIIKFFKENKSNEVNLEHQLKIKGVYLFESFILDENKKIEYPEFADVEIGSWIVSYYVENDEIWKLIKDGQFNGFSVEVYGWLNRMKQKDVEELQEIYELLSLLNYK